MKQHLFLVGIAFLGVHAAGAAVEDMELTLGELRPFAMGTGDRVVQNLYPIASAAVSNGAAPSDGNALAVHSSGMTVSEQTADYSVGDFVKTLPAAAGEIDWDKTIDGLTKSKAYADGFVTVIRSTTNAYEKILFTGGGAIQVVWQFTNNTSKTSVYQVKTSADSRPYRIFWTSSPFNAPSISLEGKFVRLFGPTGVLGCTYENSTAAGVSNIVTGVYLDEKSHTLQAAAKVIDYDKGLFQGPQGQFVLCYYTSGKMDQYVGHVVVEVTGPQVKIRRCHVGDELRPTGDGYDIKGLLPMVQKGAKTETGDPASPHVAVFDCRDYVNKDSLDEKVSVVYAISPTDKTVSAVGADTPGNADIYWEKPDLMGTLWPFEEIWYLVSWNPDDPKMVFDTSVEGLPAFFPTNYQVSVENLYQDPPQTAVVKGQGVSVNKAGRFLVKIKEGTDKFWFQPFQSVSHTSNLVCNANNPVSDRTVPVGQQLLPLDVGLGGTAQAAYGAVDKSLSGYIHRGSGASADVNWNPRLYHEPTAPTYVDTTLPGAETDAFAALESSIYAVNEGKGDDHPVEIWWRGLRRAQSRLFGTSLGIEYPAAVQRYGVRPAKRSDWPEIAIASCKGSANVSLGASEQSLVLAASNAFVNINLEADPAHSLKLDTNGCTVAFWLKPSPQEYSPATNGTGRVFTLGAAVSGGRIAMTLDCTSVAGDKAVMRFTAVGTASAPFNLERGSWTPLTLRIDPREGGKDFKIALRSGGADVASVSVPAGQYPTALAGIGFGRSAANDDVAASGFAVGGISVWNRALGNEECDAQRLVPGSAEGTDKSFAWDFAPESVKTESRTGTDGVTVVETYAESRAPKGGRLEIAGTCGFFSPGPPMLSEGFMSAYAGGVTPTVYRQAVEGQPGYHPNHAHAFLWPDDQDSTKYVTWALRSDLGTAGESALVFTMYNDNGRGAMHTSWVVLTNRYYDTFGSETKVGRVFRPPNPIPYLEGYWNNRTQWCSLQANNGADKQIVHRDRKMNDWARRAGGGFAFYHYPLRSDFDLPSGVTVGSDRLLPWLSCLDGFSAEKAQSGAPLAWPWRAEWPDEQSVPTMYVGQTLTKAANGLPEVYNMASCAVLYPLADTTVAVGGAPRPASVVSLVDPIQARSAALDLGSDFPKKYGFTVGQNGTCQLSKGKYTFTDLPPSVSKRFYIDTEAAKGSEMKLVGNLETPATGNAYLQLNVLTESERQAIKDICKKTDADKTNWDKAVNSLAKEPVVAAKALEQVQDWDSRCVPPPGDRRTVTNRLTRLETLAKYGTGAASADVAVETVNTSAVAYVTHRRPQVSQYVSVEKYALMATGDDAGYVVLIENDNTDTKVVPEGNPIDVKVIRVVPELYRGTITSLTDPLNKLSEQLTLQYNEPFGAATANYEFDWRREGVSVEKASFDVWTRYERSDLNPTGLVSFTVGQAGATLDVLGNQYYVMRYRANAGTTAALTLTNGTAWSGWTEKTLAESWVQRVLNSVTPFSQRIEDLYNNAAELKYTMFEQIGRPYTGDVALNNDNLSSVGLIELYQTVLNKAEKMSLGLNQRNADVNKQLLQAASRLSDLYQLLGAEAYADAKNPLVSQGTSADDLGELLSLPSSTFCFQNQVATLLDEELALLRGRSLTTEFPNMKTTPYFNRLLWNFTKGVTEGEVAYVNNYGISSVDGVITVDTAAAQYPQGHGDAWGHYLSAMTGYYRLLRNPCFDWHATVMEMLVSQSVVNEDYYDENKFADAALKLAQTGLDVVDLTARKAWRDNGGDLAAAYFDDVSGTNGSVRVRQAFGYGQCAVRAGLGTIYHWATVNSLLPTNAVADGAYADAGIRKIDRTTATQLPQLALAFNALQEKMDALDSGLNPLGLSQDAVSMDIDPAKLEEKNSHFDQILERTEQALANCSKTLDYANRYGARLQQIQNAESEATASQKTQETAYRNQLIAIYGTPYSDDIGAGGLYAQGYDGPDLYHYHYMDLEQLGLSEQELRTSFTMVLTNKTYDAKTGDLTKDDLKDGDKTVVTYEVTSGGIVKKPSNFTGVRATEGSVQTAYRAYLDAYVTTTRALKSYDGKIGALQGKYEKICKQFDAAEAAYAKKLLETAFKYLDAAITEMCENADKELESQEKIADASSEVVSKSVPDTVIGGLAVSMPSRSLVDAAKGPVALTKKAATESAKKDYEEFKAFVDKVTAQVQTIADLAKEGADLTDKKVALESDVQNLFGEVSDSIKAVVDAMRRLTATEAAYRQEVYKGQLLLEEREQWRRQRSSDATRSRYADMFNRIQRNNALTKYSTSFDVAQRYVWELAKVYDYETALLSSDSQAGDAFLAEIVGSRQLGYEGVSSSSATDKGLYDIVNRMKGNWAVLRHRLGVDNPETTTKWFSLRYSLFRILRDAKGDEAWQDTLARCRVDNILDDPRFRRYCQPMDSATREILKEPGLVLSFSTSVNSLENFFGNTLMGGESAYSSSDYATKVHSLGVKLVGYDRLATESASGLALEPNIYLVPVGQDFMRAPAGTSRKVIAFNVVDQVLPLPYAVGSAELDDTDYVASFQGIDGTSDSAAVIRRHSTLQADGSVYSTRLVGRSVWNSCWMLVIPASALNGVDPDRALDRFIEGVDDIQIGIRAYSRSGN